MPRSAAGSARAQGRRLERHSQDAAAEADRVRAEAAESCAEHRSRMLSRRPPRRWTRRLRREAQEVERCCQAGRTGCCGRMADGPRWRSQRASAQSTRSRGRAGRVGGYRGRPGGCSAGSAGAQAMLPGSDAQDAAAEADRFRSGGSVVCPEHGRERPGRSAGHGRCRRRVRPLAVLETAREEAAEHGRTAREAAEAAALSAQQEAQEVEDAAKREAQAAAAEADRVRSGNSRVCAENASRRLRSRRQRSAAGSRGMRRSCGPRRSRSCGALAASALRRRRSANARSSMPQSANVRVTLLPPSGRRGRLASGATSAHDRDRGPGASSDVER